jgi:hypothetical protein
MTEAAAAMEMPPPPTAGISVAKLPRRRFFSDMPDRGLFVAVALLGFVAVCVLKVRGHDPNIVAALTVALMVAYGTTAFQIPLVRMRLDRLGDNFYYLGFIFTLASLSAALLQLQGGVRIEELLGSFGIALVTTIVGIAGRVLFVQLRSEVDDIEEHVRHDLAAASADLRAQLSAAIRDFETFRTGLFQTLNETQEQFTKANAQQEERLAAHARTVAEQMTGAASELQKEFAAVLLEFETFRKKFATAGKKHTDQIELFANSSAEKLDTIFNTSQQHSQQALEAVEAISRAVESAMRRLAEFELPGEELNREFRHFVGELEKLTARLGANSSSAPRFSTKPHRLRRIWSLLLRRPS